MVKFSVKIFEGIKLHIRFVKCKPFPVSGGNYLVALEPTLNGTDLQQQLYDLFAENPGWAVILSICAGILIAVLGLLPSFFLTAANILFFGFWQGTLVSFAGEALGAIIAFILYRKGIQRYGREPLARFPQLQKLLGARGREAFFLVFSLRLFPFVPSGLVTLAAAIGTISASAFFFASSLGKIPALLMEAYSVYQVTQFGWQGKLILGIAGLFILGWIIIKRKRAS